MTDRVHHVDIHMKGIWDGTTVVTLKLYTPGNGCLDGMPLVTFILHVLVKRSSMTLLTLYLFKVACIYILTQISGVQVTVYTMSNGMLQTHYMYV